MCVAFCPLPSFLETTLFMFDFRQNKLPISFNGVVKLNNEVQAVYQSITNLTDRTRKMCLLAILVTVQMNVLVVLSVYDPRNMNRRQNVLFVVSFVASNTEVSSQ